MFVKIECAIKNIKTLYYKAEEIVSVGVEHRPTAKDQAGKIVPEIFGVYIATDHNRIIMAEEKTEKEANKKAKLLVEQITNKAAVISCR